MLLTYCVIHYVQDDEYRGKGTTSGQPHFHCGHKNGVWVSMDMVVYPPLPTTATGRHAPHNSTSASKPSYGTGKQTSHVHKTAHQHPSSETGQYVQLPRGDESHRSNIYKMMASKAWKYIAGIEDKEQQQQQQQHSEAFKEGDHVQVYSLKDQRPITATVCWTGMVKLSCEGHVPKVMFAGLETVSCVLIN